METSYTTDCKSIKFFRFGSSITLCQSAPLPCLDTNSGLTSLPPGAAQLLCSLHEARDQLTRLYRFALGKRGQLSQFKSGLPFSALPSCVSTGVFSRS